MTHRGNGSTDTPHGWVVEDPYGEGLTFVVTGRWTDETTKALIESEVVNLEINTGRGFRSPSLEFIEDWRIRRLLVLDWDLSDVAPLERLSSLEELRLDVAPDARVDLMRFPRLSTLASGWSNVRDSIEERADTLQTTSLGGYDGSNLGAFACLSNLESLELLEPPSLHDLGGGEWGSLKRLTIAHAPQLADLEALSTEAFPALEHLEFESCPRLTDISAVARVDGLKHIGVNDCRVIDSISSLRSLTDMEVAEFWGSTVIGDNDLEVLLELPRLREVRLADKRSYVPRRRIIDEHLAARTGRESV